MEQSYHINKQRKKDSLIMIDDLIIVSNESQLSHFSKGRQKFVLKWIDPYKITKIDQSKSNYILNIKDFKRYSIFHISNIKKYMNLHLELFPNRQRR